MKITKTKTRRGKKFLENRAPKITENDKNAFIIKGGKTNELISNVLHELYSIKKPLAQLFRKHNPFHPFEDDTGLIKFAQKFDSSLFLFGINTKKRPNCLIFGRLYDYQILDMIELQISLYVPMSKFKEGSVTFGLKPCIVLQGALFETDETMQRLGNLMIDWFRGPTVSSVRLQGLELVISITAITETKLMFRVYKTTLKKTETKYPRVELVEIGPRINFVICRKKLASYDLFKTAMQKPKELKIKPKKNISCDVFNTKSVRIHVGKQQPHTIQTRKVKALKMQKVQK